MEHKNLLILLVPLLFTLNVNAQAVTYSGHMTSSKRLNAFTWGDHPVTTISDNFENLFRNVPQMISNPDSLQFIRYEYVATLRGKEDAVNYFLKNIHKNAPIVYYYSIGNKLYISISTLQNFQREGSIKLFKKWIDEKNIQKGDQVYRIDFIVNHKNMQHYVFVNPETKQVVVTKDSYFGHIIQDMKFETERKVK